MNEHQSESGQDIEKLLTEVTPQADAHFQEKLEGQLLAAYLQKKESDKVKANGHLVTYTDFVPQMGVGNRHRRWSITLVATLMMALLVGFILMSIRNNPQMGYSGASLLTTPTVTYAPSSTPEAEIFQPVVVATMHISLGTIFSADMLEVQQWKPSYIPLNSFTRVEDLIGAMSRTEIPSKSPIIQSQVIMLDDLAMIDFPLEENGLRPVVVTTSDLVRGTILSDEMLDIVYWPADGLPTGSFPVPTLLIGQRLVTDLRANSPILTRHLNVDSENQTSTIMDAGHVAVAVSLPRDKYFYGFQVGDIIGVTAILQFIDVPQSSEYQAIPIQGTPTPPFFSDDGIVEPSTETPYPQVVISEAITDAKIISLHFDESLHQLIMVLTLPPQEAEVLVWLIDSGNPYFYRGVTPTLQENSPNLEPQGALPNESTSVGISPDVSTELKPIVITTQAIPRGTIITEEMLTIGYTTSELADLVPFDNIEEYVGRMAISNLPAYSLILDNQVVGYEKGQTPPVGEEFITIPLAITDIGNVAFGFIPGDHIDIVASLLTVPSDDSTAPFCRGLFSSDGTSMPCPDIWDTDQAETVTQKVIEDAEVVSLGGSDDIMTMTLKMSPADQEVMNWLLDANVPLAYVLR